MSSGEYILHNQRIGGKILNDGEFTLRHDVHIQDDEILNVEHYRL